MIMNRRSSHIICVYRYSSLCVLLLTSQSIAYDVTMPSGELTIDIELNLSQYLRPVLLENGLFSH